MLNKIWFALLLIGIGYGFAKGVYRTAAGTDEPPSATQSAVPHPLSEAGQKLTGAALGAAKTAVELCIVLIGMMALWLGMLNIARDAGLVDALARALRPVTRRLFPEIPAGHSAEGPLLMNLSANVLGLGNAATPFGLKAMRELQKLNPDKDTATNAMATFLAINTSSVTLVPFTIIGLRVASGSTNAAAPLAGIIATTAVSTTVAIVAAGLLSRWPRFAAEPPASAGADRQGQDSAGPGG